MNTIGGRERAAKGRNVCQQRTDLITTRASSAAIDGRTAQYMRAKPSTGTPSCQDDMIPRASSEVRSDGPCRPA